MNAMTVEGLFKCMKKEMEKGHKDYVVFVTDDEEANGYHALWYSATTPEEMDVNERRLFEQSNCDLVCAEQQGSTDMACYIG